MHEFHDFRGIAGFAALEGRSEQYCFDGKFYGNRDERCGNCQQQNCRCLSVIEIGIRALYTEIFQTWFALSWKGTIFWKNGN